MRPVGPNVFSCTAVVTGTGSGTSRPTWASDASGTPEEQPMSVVAATRRWSSRAMALIAWARALAYRILDTVPPVRRTVDELLRVEFVDRAVVIAAQALFALVPLVVVLAAYLPDALHQGLDRFEAVTGLSSSRVAAVPVDAHLA